MNIKFETPMEVLDLRNYRNRLVVVVPKRVVVLTNTRVGIVVDLQVLDETPPHMTEPTKFNVIIAAAAIAFTLRAAPRNSTVLGRLRERPRDGRPVWVLDAASKEDHAVAHAALEEGTNA
ncbi:MAG: hypothetical protein LLG14_19625 [Nocardiaceae bacterium]|nr:hypothetical protein [Nocardiaceae bacterium]